EECLAAPALLFGALAVVDIDDHPEPLRDATLGVTQGLADRLRPSKLTVGAAQLVDVVVRRAGSDRMHPAPHGGVAVIGMDHLEPSSSRQALRGVAEVCDGALIQVIEVAFGCTAPDQRRYGFDEQTELPLALT